MIINNLYPDGTSRWWTGDTYHQYEDVLSETAGQYGFTGFKPDSYYLGWIKKENLPVIALHSSCTVDDTVYTFVEDTDEDNFPVGYVYSNTNRNFMQNGEMIKNDDDTYSTQYSGLCYINQWYPEYSAYYTSSNASNIQIYCYAYISDAGGNFVTRTSFSHSNMTGLNSSDVRSCYNFLHYDVPITVDFGSQYGTLEFLSSDLDEGTFYKETSNGYFARVFLISYIVPSQVYIKHATDSLVRITQFEPFSSITYGGKTGSYSKTLLYGFGGYSGYARRNYQNNFSWLFVNNTSYGQKQGDLLVGMQGTIDISLLNSLHPYMWDGNVLAEWRQYSGSLFEVDFYCIMTRQDIRKSFSMHFRVDLANYTKGYVNGVTYATDVTAQDEFLARLKTGDLINPEFKNSLRPWQYENFQENDFTEEDVPPYEPEPEPGGDTPSEEPEDMPHDEGDPAGLQDRTIPAPSLFITQYALTYEDVQAVGANLWQSWLTPSTDVWKNFFLPYSQDFGTLNIGAALDCIISLRAYPFDIPLDVLLPAANGVRMGTGHTDFLGYATAKVNASTCKIPLGDCVVKPKTPYEDFRDMYNTSVSCFLPYCGTVELNPPEVMNRTLHCYYCIDFQSGGCTAFITLDGDEGEYIIASKSGQIGFLLPITATNAGQLAAQKGQDAVETIGTLAGFFFDVAGELAQSSENAIKALAGIESGKSDKDSVPIGTTLTSSLKIGESGVNTGLALANQALKRLSRSGVGVPAISGGSGIEAIYAPDTAVISIRRGKYAKPINYPHSQAHLNGSSGQIGTFKGDWGKYTPKTGKGLCKFTGVDTTGLKCHDDERAEIVALLESGVYI